jgi:hypothetical protein
MDATPSSETLATIYRTTRRYILAYSNLQPITYDAEEVQWIAL